jgi:very-short-patch-repair endonuclease
MDPPSRTVEQKLARMASRAHGIVDREELLGAGLAAMEIRGRLRKGVLIREFAGVYRVGHRAPSVEARYMAAVRACGKGAVLSGRAAAYLWGLIKGSPPMPEVTARTERRIEGIRTRRVRDIASVEATTCRGVPVTTVPRTLVDLAAALSLDDLAHACHEAGVRYGTTPRDVNTILARRPPVRGARNLRKVLHGDVRVTLSKLERRFLERLQEAGLPLPETNRPAGGHRVDCRWPEHRLTVELDGYRYHHSRHAWEQDRRREREARKRGDEHRRYTYADVEEDPTLMMAELHTLLTSRRSEPYPTTRRPPGLSPNTASVSSPM